MATRRQMRKWIMGTGNKSVPIQLNNSGPELLVVRRHSFTITGWVTELVPGPPWKEMQEINALEGCFPLVRAS